MEVHLTPQQQAFIEQNVRAGRFASNDDAVRAAVELLEEWERELEQLRAGVDEADDDIAHGRYSEYTGETLPQLFEELKREGRVLKEAGSSR
ncbi:MAG: type II toxin-antitoxin system ParD family antitoxin [Bryobacteraceae bacterium]